MVNFDDIFDRIKLATSTRTQVELADVLGIRQSSISDAKRRNSVPADWYMKLFEQFGLNPDWLKKAHGPMYLRTEQGYAPVEASAAGMLFEDAAQYGGQDARSALVTVYATQHTENTDDAAAHTLGKLCVPQSFAGAGVYVIKVDSSSMVPFIQKGAYVGIDTTQKHVTSGELYGVRLPYEGLVIKRTFIDVQNNKLVLRSYNETLPEIALPLENYESNIVGRVVWIFQRI